MQKVRYTSYLVYMCDKRRVKNLWWKDLAGTGEKAHECGVQQNTLSPIWGTCKQQMNERTD